jgi:acyl carrier protein
MNEQEFLEFFKQLLETSEEVEMDTEFRYMDEWSSLTGLAFITDMGEKYGKVITPAEVKASETVEDLFNLYKSK